jgi:hypothetical protein
MMDLLFYFANQVLQRAGNFDHALLRLRAVQVNGVDERCHYKQRVSAWPPI